MKIQITQKDPHSSAWYNYQQGAEFDVVSHENGAYNLGGGLTVPDSHATLVVEKREMKVVEKPFKATEK